MGFVVRSNKLKFSGSIGAPLYLEQLLFIICLRTPHDIESDSWMIIVYIYKLDTFDMMSAN